MSSPLSPCLLVPLFLSTRVPLCVCLLFLSVCAYICVYIYVCVTPHSLIHSMMQVEVSKYSAKVHESYKLGVKKAVAYGVFTGGRC